ncbi:MAG: cell division protein FtsK, partial [Gammaproteobacteria bacterium]|nr:cell division protein FtsK [Gammaproteobacteria bacterium]
MPENAADTSVSDRFTETVKRALREGAVILTGVLALMLFASLVTYQPSDPGFSFTGEGPQGEIGNLIGRQGAWLADTLFFLFGGPAYLFPIMLGAS